MLKKFGTILITGILVASMFSCSDISESSEIKTEKNVVKVSDKVATYSYIGDYQSAALKEALENNNRSAISENKIINSVFTSDSDDLNVIVDYLLENNYVTDSVANYIRKVNLVIESDILPSDFINSVIAIQEDAAEVLSDSDFETFMYYSETVKGDYEIFYNIYDDGISSRGIWKKLKKAAKIVVSAAGGAVVGTAVGIISGTSVPIPGVGTVSGGVVGAVVGGVTSGIIAANSGNISIGI